MYRQYYHYSNSSSLRQLYILILSLVRPHLNYSAQIWNPHLQHDINALESVQKLGLKLCSISGGIWATINCLMFDSSSLQNYCLHLKLYNVTCSKLYMAMQCYFPPDNVNRNTNHTHLFRPFLNSTATVVLYELILFPFLHPQLYSYLEHVT